MILQYPGAFAVTQPGQNLVQPGIPQVHAAIPVAAVNGNGMTAQMPVSAAMMVSNVAPPAQGAGGGTAGAAVIPSQMVPMSFPGTFDYSGFLDPRGATGAVIPRRSRRSQRHRRHHDNDNDNDHHRRRSTSQSSGSSEEDSPRSGSSYDSAEYPRHRRTNSGRNPLPRPPKDVLTSTPFRPILTQLPSAQYNSWGIGGTSSLMPQPQPQTQPQPTTYSNVRPRRERRGLFNRRQGDQFPVPSLSAAVNTLTQPFHQQGMGMGMPEPQPAPPQPQPSPYAAGPHPSPYAAGPHSSPYAAGPHPSPYAAGPHPSPYAAGPSTPGHIPPVIPSNSPMPMPNPEPAPMNQQGPVIPPGIPMPSPAPAGSTPFMGPNLGTPRMPRSTPGPPPGQMMQGFAPSPSSGPMQMPTPMPGGGGNMSMPMPSPSAGASGLGQMQMGIPPPGSILVNPAMPSPSLGMGGAGGGMAPVLKFNGYGEFAGLLYHSPHSVVYEDDLYPTALHLFEARKFLDHRPDLAEQIRRCSRVEEVTAISAQLAEFTRRDWGNVALSTMDDVLYLKFRQHGELRALLLNTYPTDLVYVESGDPFWGDGAGAGMNQLGQSLMRVREQLRMEGSM
ncbi:hypothetical protein DFH94DRAFT_700190 [Russula ochroleuca]|uniref:NADAR domain-containing protein n=1 Tax=Russula ochroleuca TaxID=152965 RepID=A0A9P5JTL4_9AGAM|nr:hypothetical protein DFH94DRAFT_700190 [Russula ochroleuca]